MPRRRVTSRRVKAGASSGGRNLAPNLGDKGIYESDAMRRYLGPFSGKDFLFVSSTVYPESGEFARRNLDRGRFPGRGAPIGRQYDRAGSDFRRAYIFISSGFALGAGMPS